MKVLEPREMQRRQDERNKRIKKRGRPLRRVYFIVLVVIIYIATIALSPVPRISATVTPPKAIQAQPANIVWPADGQAAIGAVGYGLLEQRGEQTPLPTASVAKIVTALAVLKAHPIVSGAQPSTITMTQADEDMYHQYASEGQSVAPVRAGQILTEYQAMQAMLLPSANNMAESLSIWAYGSETEYIAFANTFVKSLGMNSTTIADASGFSPQTVSTATDLVKLAETVMNSAVMTDIVSQHQADIPLTGSLHNTNYLLGRSGIIGIKTGNTSEAGGCYLFAAKRSVGGRDLVVVGAVMGAANLYQAMSPVPSLIDQTYSNFKESKILSAGQVVGKLNRVGQSGTDVVVKTELNTVYWASAPPKYEVIIDDMGDKPVVAGSQVGTIIVASDGQTHKIPLVAVSSVPVQPLLKRLITVNGRLTL
ncbi:MAG: hypothetical protein ABI354_00740 [Candidatus Saccharimonadales bacterium]